MEIDRTALKQQAREAMRLPRPSFWKVTLVFLLLSSGVNWLSDLLAASLSAGTGLQAPALFLSILFALYSAIISFGYQLWCLWTYRRQNPGLGALFQGFSIAGRVLWMQIIIMVQTSLFCIPVVLLYTMFLIGNSYPIFAMLVAVPIVVAAMIAFTFRFALAPYVLADNPDAGASLAIRRSAELMRGWKWELFKLDFSFIGWLILLEVLRLLAACAALAGSGFFALLAQLPAAELPGLIPGYVVWLNDFSGTLGSFSDTQIQLFTLFSQVGEGTFASLLGDLFSLPLLLWLTPYRRVAHAAFYDARQAMPEAAAQDLPPL